MSTEDLIKVQPLSPEAVPLVMCCDDNYLPYAGVVLQSLADNGDPTTFYDVCLLTDGPIGQADQDRLAEMNLPADRISLRLFDISGYAERCRAAFTSRHITLAAYYRLFIPEIFQAYERVIYLDCDLVVLADLKPLYETDLEGRSLGGVPDLVILMRYDRGLLLENSVDAREHIDQVLKKRYPHTYIFSGLLVIDTARSLAVDRRQSLIGQALKKNYLYHDQDVVNEVFDGDIKLLKQKWNLVSHAWEIDFGGVSEITAACRRDYDQALKAPAVFHYGGKKPWQYLTVYRADLFWEYAVKTPFFDIIQSRLESFQPLPDYRGMERIFSFKNVGNHKVLTLLGLRFKWMRKKAAQVLAGIHKTR